MLNFTGFQILCVQLVELEFNQVNSFSVYIFKKLVCFENQGILGGRGEGAVVVFIKMFLSWIPSGNFDFYYLIKTKEGILRNLIFWIPPSSPLLRDPILNIYSECSFKKNTQFEAVKETFYISFWYYYIFYFLLLSSQVYLLHFIFFPFYLNGHRTSWLYLILLPLLAQFSFISSMLALPLYLQWNSSMPNAIFFLYFAALKGFKFKSYTVYTILKLLTFLK